LGYVIVVLLAALAGGLVYWASMRFAGDAGQPGGDGPTDALDERGQGREGPERGAETNEAAPRAEAQNGPPSAPGPGTAYIPVLRARGSWQGRVSGIMGLVIAVAIGAATTAFVLYEAGHIISKLLSSSGNG